MTPLASLALGSLGALGILPQGNLANTLTLSKKLIAREITTGKNAMSAMYVMYAMSAKPKSKTVNPGPEGVNSPPTAGGKSAAGSQREVDATRNCR
jgi:hypothetical protein